MKQNNKKINNYEKTYIYMPFGFAGDDGCQL